MSLSHSCKQILMTTNKTSNMNIIWCRWRNKIIPNSSHVGCPHEDINFDIFDYQQKRGLKWVAVCTGWSTRSWDNDQNTGSKKFEPGCNTAVFILLHICYFPFSRWSVNPFVRMSVWSVFFGRFVSSSQTVGTGQTSVQRYCAVKTMRGGIMWVGFFIVFFFMF